MEQKDLLRKVTVKTNAKNKIYTICVSKKGATDPHVIWIKMVNLQNGSVHQNLLCNNEKN